MRAFRATNSSLAVVSGRRIFANPATRRHRQHISVFSGGEEACAQSKGREEIFGGRFSLDRSGGLILSRNYTYPARCVLERVHDGSFSRDIQHETSKNQKEGGEEGGGRSEGASALVKWLAVGCAVGWYVRTQPAHCEHQHSELMRKYEQGIFPRVGVSKIATMINALVDMEYFTEEEEQEIFEHSVCLVLHEIEKALPDTVIRLIIEADDEDGVDDDLAATLNERLLDYVTKEVSLPYLDYTDEARVMAAVCAVIVESMKKGRHFDEVVEPVNSGELIIDVFVKGAVGIFDSNNKKEFVSNICIDLNVPFVPDNLKRWVVGMMLEAVGDVFEESILKVYQHRISEAFAWATDRAEDARSSEEWELLLARSPQGRFPWSREKYPVEMVHSGPKFASGRFFKDGNLVLPDRKGQRTYGEEVRDTLVDALNERINIIGWVCDKFEEWEGLLIRKVVDLTLMQGMDCDKLEIVVTYLCKENFLAALRHEWYEAFKGAQIPFPKSRVPDEYYWELAGEYTAIDLERIKDVKEEPKGRTMNANKVPARMKQRRRSSTAPIVGQ